MIVKKYGFKRISYAEYEYSKNGEVINLKSSGKSQWRIYVKTKCYVLKSGDLWTNMPDARKAGILMFEALGGQMND